MLQPVHLTPYQLRKVREIFTTASRLRREAARAAEDVADRSRERHRVQADLDDNADAWSPAHHGRLSEDRVGALEQRLDVIAAELELAIKHRDRLRQAAQQASEFARRLQEHLGAVGTDIDAQIRGAA